MDRNIMILIIFLLILLFYDSFCNNKIIEASTTSGSPIPTTGGRNDGITIYPDLINSERNSFTYENTNPPDSGFLGFFAQYLAQDLDIDSINDGTYSGTLLDTIGFKGMSEDTNSSLCEFEYPGEDKTKYDVVRDGVALNLYDECKKPESISRKRSLCLLNDTKIPIGKDSTGSDVYRPYYMYDNYKEKCTYSPPSFLTSGNFCNVHEDKTSCLVDKISSGSDADMNHCQWINSFRSYPAPTRHETEFCSKQSKENCNNISYTNESNKDTGRKICTYAENHIIKPKDGDEAGECAVDPTKYIGGVSFEKVALDTNTNKRYIKDGKCMDNCSVTGEKDCNDRFSCIWVDNAAPSLDMRGISASDNFKKWNKSDTHDTRNGMCINKEIFYEMQNKDIYDQSKICGNFNDDPDKCNGSMGDDSWHCIMKNFAGSCVEAGTKNMDINESYVRNDDALACQSMFNKDIIDKKLNTDAEYTKLTDESLKSGYIYDYISNNPSDMKSLCEAVTYVNGSLQMANGGGAVSGKQNASFCKWKPPPEPSCMYKTGADLKNPGDYKTDSGADYGPFTMNEPAYYYNNIFPPHCEMLTESECSPTNCFWNGTNCKAKCVRLGSNTTKCGISSDDQRKYIKDTLDKQVNSNILSDSDVANKKIDDYTHCAMHPVLNTCVLKDDLTGLDSKYWSSEVPEYKSTQSTTVPPS